MSKPDVALFGFAKFFKAASLEEQEHARKLVEFVNMRGGSVQLCDVLKPETGDFHDPEVALEESITLEKNVLKVGCHLVVSWFNTLELGLKNIPIYHM